MSEYTPYWEGIIRGFRTSGGDPWQVCIEIPESKDGLREPSVNFSRGQSVHVLTDEGLNRIKAEAWDEGADDAASYFGISEYGQGTNVNPYREVEK